uniref:Uncharacterized protein n=1 Tax=Arundo donax TaxID=35708 RepID=A0A0A9HCC9_ARUDO
MIRPVLAGSPKKLVMRSDQGLDDIN